ncbi:MAG: class I SAM-dependent methyltransferase [Candidatus Limnocylindria bacterium]
MSRDCCTPDYDAFFNDDEARRDLLEYRAKGPDGTTRRLRDALVAEGVQGATLLDVGGGVGAMQLELLAAGVASAVDVDASAPYLQVAEAEARDRGLADRVTYLHGDFVQMADQVAAADVVTLHRVICCYADVDGLVSRSAERARRLYGLVYPVDRWWTRLAFRLGNLFCRIARKGFQVRVHPTAVVDRLLRDAGLEPVSTHAGWVWQTALYRRPDQSPERGGGGSYSTVPTG